MHVGGDDPDTGVLGAEGSMENDPLHILTVYVVLPDAEAWESRVICFVNMNHSVNEPDACVIDTKDIIVTVGAVPPDACTGEA